MTKSITSLSSDDIRWIHQAAVTDMERAVALYPDLTEGERDTWRIMCTIAALNAQSLFDERSR